MSSPEVSSIATGDLRCAEDAIEVLSGLADLVEQAGDTSYASHLRRDAAAVALFTSRHPSGQDLNMQQQVGTHEHRSLLRARLRSLFPAPPRGESPPQQ